VKNITSKTDARVVAGWYSCTGRCCCTHQEL